MYSHSHVYPWKRIKHKVLIYINLLWTYLCLLLRVSVASTPQWDLVVFLPFICALVLIDDDITLNFLSAISS